jgi:hypothetical protein
MMMIETDDAPSHAPFDAPWRTAESKHCSVTVNDYASLNRVMSNCCLSSLEAAIDAPA